MKKKQNKIMAVFIIIPVLCLCAGVLMASLATDLSLNESTFLIELALSMMFGLTITYVLIAIELRKESVKVDQEPLISMAMSSLENGGEFLFVDGNADVSIMKNMRSTSLDGAL